MPDNTPALVVIAAGGLGTRVHGWARFIPKEFYPVGGRPGITRLLEEIGALGPARVAIVYHPYYEPFAAWGRQVLSPSWHVRYCREAGLDIPAAVPPGVCVTLIPQQGPYGDLTSVFNGADCLAARESLYIAFADNLYPGVSPLELLRDADGGVAVLASTYRRALAPVRGISLPARQPTGNRGRSRRWSKNRIRPRPGHWKTSTGTASLLMLEGRARLTAPFIRFARGHQDAAPRSEPKPSLALGAYAREHQVVAVPADAEVIDLGVPAVPPPASTPGVGGR